MKIGNWNEWWLWFEFREDVIKQKDATEDERWEEFRNMKVKQEDKEINIQRKQRNLNGPL